MHANRSIAGRRSLGSASLLTVWTAVMAAGCGSLLDVENPNNVKGDDVALPVAAASVANGSLASVSRAVVQIALLTGTATDEFDWSGSRDGWNELDHGNVNNPYNEFTNGAFPNIAEARWLSNEAVNILETHQANKALKNQSDLARAYLSRAVIYSSIAEQFSDWALSSRDTAVAPLGKANMGPTFFDVAITSCDKGLAITGISDALRLQLTTMKARAQFAKSIRGQIFTSPISVGAVGDAAAAATATAAIGLLPSADWKFQFQYGASSVGNDFRGWVINRQEMRVGKVYANPDPDAPTWTTTALLDPITGAVDPVIDREQKDFKAATYPPFTVTSAREMRLIVAEDALARSDMSTFATQINAIRAIDNLTAWDQAAPQVPALTILHHERRVSLFLQGKRLADHYRFGPSTYPVDWFSNATAVTNPGTLLPIAAVECLSNEFIGAENCGK